MKILLDNDRFISALIQFAELATHKEISEMDGIKSGQYSDAAQKVFDCVYDQMETIMKNELNIYPDIYEIPN